MLDYSSLFPATLRPGLKHSQEEHSTSVVLMQESKYSNTVKLPLPICLPLVWHSSDLQQSHHVPHFGHSFHCSRASSSTSHITIVATAPACVSSDDAQISPIYLHIEEAIFNTMSGLAELEAEKEQYREQVRHQITNTPDRNATN